MQHVVIHGNWIDAKERESKWWNEVIKQDKLKKKKRDKGDNEEPRESGRNDWKIKKMPKRCKDMIGWWVAKPHSL